MSRNMHFPHRNYSKLIVEDLSKISWQGQSLKPSLREIEETSSMFKNWGLVKEGWLNYTTTKIKNNDSHSWWHAFDGMNTVCHFSLVILTTRCKAGASSPTTQRAGRIRVCGPPALGHTANGPRVWPQALSCACPSPNSGTMVSHQVRREGCWWQRVRWVKQSSMS